MLDRCQEVSSAYVLLDCASVTDRSQRGPRRLEIWLRGPATNIICSFGDLRPDLARPRRHRTPSGLPMDDCCIASQPRRITIFARTCLHAALTRQQDNQKVMRSTPSLLKSCTFRRWCQELRLTLLPTRPFACSPISAVTCG